MTIETEKLTGQSLIDRVKELIHEGNVRRIIIKNDDGHTIIELPVTIGVIGAIFAPAVAAVGAIAALLTSCTLEIVRDEAFPVEHDGKIILPPIEKQEENLEDKVIVGDD